MLEGVDGDPLVCGVAVENEIFNQNGGVTQARTGCCMDLVAHRFLHGFGCPPVAAWIWGWLEPFRSDQHCWVALARSV